MFNLINKLKNRKGFTLIELIVVLAVLLIIAAIAVPRFTGVQSKAKENADDITIDTVQKALELCVVSEDITVETDTVICTVSTSGFSVPSTPIIALETIQKYLDTSTAKLQKSNATSVSFTLTTDGKITH